MAFIVRVSSVKILVLEGNRKMCEISGGRRGRVGVDRFALFVGVKWREEDLANGVASGDAADDVDDFAGEQQFAGIDVKLCFCISCALYVMKENTDNGSQDASLGFASHVDGST